MTAGAVRFGSLLVSGIPTLLAWLLLSHEAPTQVFAGIALAQGLPMVVSSSARSLGAPIVLAFPHGAEAVRRQFRRTLISTVVVAVGLVALGLITSTLGFWSLIFGSKFAGFNLDGAVLVSATMVAAWIPTIVFERLLIGRGRVVQAIVAAAATGPVTLAVVWLFALMSEPSWWWVSAFWFGNLVSGVILALLGGRVMRTLGHDLGAGGADWRPRRGTGSSFAAAEIAGMVSLWVARPLMALVAPVSEVALFAFSYQVMQPVLSVTTSAATAWWRGYSSREVLPRRDVVTDGLKLGAAGGVLAAGALGAWWIAHALSLTPYRLGWGLAVVWAVAAFVMSALRPLRLAQSVGQLVSSLLVSSVAGLMVLLPSAWLLTVAFGSVGTVASLIASFLVVDLLTYLTLGSKVVRR